MSRDNRLLHFSRRPDGYTLLMAHPNVAAIDPVAIHEELHNWRRYAKSAA